MLSLKSLKLKRVAKCDTSGGDTVIWREHCPRPYLIILFFPVPSQQRFILQKKNVTETSETMVESSRPNHPPMGSGPALRLRDPLVVPFSRPPANR